MAKKSKKDKKNKGKKKRTNFLDEGGDANAERPQSTGADSAQADFSRDMVPLHDPITLNSLLVWVSLVIKPCWLQFAQSFVDVLFSDEDDGFESLSPSSSVLAAPATGMPLTPNPTITPCTTTKEEGLTDLAPSVPPLNGQGPKCTQSLTYAITMPAIGLNNGLYASVAY